MVPLADFELLFEETQGCVSDLGGTRSEQLFFQLLEYALLSGFKLPDPVLEFAAGWAGGREFELLFRLGKLCVRLVKRLEPRCEGGGVAGLGRFIGPEGPGAPAEPCDEATGDQRFHEVILTWETLVSKS